MSSKRFKFYNWKIIIKSFKMNIMNRRKSWSQKICREKRSSNNLQILLMNSMKLLNNLKLNNNSFIHKTAILYITKIKLVN